MKTVIKKWGNSLALRLPQHIAADLRIAEGGTVNLDVEDRALIVRPSRVKYQLKELLADMPRASRSTEEDWGDPAGEEVW